MPNSRGGAAHRMHHGIFLFQRIAPGYLQPGRMGLGQRFALLFERGRAHVLGGRVDQIADQAHRLRLGQRAVDGLDVLGKQHPRTDGAFGFFVAIEHILAGLPAMQRWAGFAPGTAIGSFGKAFGQFRHAPARQLVRIGNAADCEPAIAVGDDADLIAATVEFLRIQRRALAGGQGLLPFGETIAIDEVDGNSVLAPVGLD